MKLITYNVWFDQKHQLARIQHIIAIIVSLEPDVVCLQEVTPEIFSIFDNYLAACYNFSKTGINQSYDTLILTRRPIKRSLTIPFPGTQMGRNLHIVELEDGDQSYVIGTFHLESIFYRKGVTRRGFYPERVKQRQLQLALDYCQDSYPDLFTVVCGDTNFNGNTQAELSDGWCDAWIEAGSSSECKFTYDGTRNANVTRRYRNRLDRVFYRGDDTKSVEFQLIGCESIQGCDIPPSDHFGIYCQW